MSQTRLALVSSGTLTLMVSFMLPCVSRADETQPTVINAAPADAAPTAVTPAESPSTPPAPAPAATPATAQPQPAQKANASSGDGGVLSYDKEIVWARGFVGGEWYSVPYLFLNGATDAQKKGVGLTAGVDGGLRAGNTRIGFLYQHTALPDSASWYKLMGEVEGLIPIWRFDISIRFAAGYANLAADGTSFKGGAAKLGVGADFRIIRYLSVGAGFDADALGFWLGMLPRFSLGGTLVGRLTAMF